MIRCGGIDIGGTKMEAQVFDDAWNTVARHRIATPADYDDFLDAVAGLVRWIDGQSGTQTPVGIGCAGAIQPQSGLYLAANVPASGKPLVQDITSRIGHAVTFLNDGHAFALSEAKFGAGIGFQTVAAVVIGTGVGGGVTVDGALAQNKGQAAGEFGQMAAPAHVVSKYDLPMTECGCGRRGCIETFISGPGLIRIAHHLTSLKLDAPDIVAQRRGDCALVWQVWCELTAELLHTLTLSVDPDVIVLGGGLSQIDGVVADLTAAQRAAQIDGFGIAPLRRAEGGAVSGAKGAAYAALQEVGHG